MLNQTYLQLCTQENNLQQIEANSNQPEKRNTKIYQQKLTFISI